MPACPATLASGPAGVVVGSGVLDAKASNFEWTPSSASVAHTVAFASVERVQRTPREKPGCKLRLVLRGGGAYVFDFAGADPHAAADAVVAVYTAAVAAGTNGPPSTSAPAPPPGSSSVPRSAPSDSKPKSAAPAKSSLAPSSSASDGSSEGVDGVATSAGSTSVASSPLSSSSSSPSTSRLSAFLRAVSGGSVFTDTDVASLKMRVLQGDAELASRYASVVGGGILQDDEFWDAHLEALVDAATSRTRQALPSLMPDELQADGAAFVKLDRGRKATIFLKEPAVHAALLVYVPGRMSEVDFWNAYINAREARRKLERGDGIPRTGQPHDPAMLEAGDFWELYRRGELDPTALLPAAAARLARAASGGSSGGSSGFDASGASSAAPRAIPGSAAGTGVVPLSSSSSSGAGAGAGSSGSAVAGKARARASAGGSGGAGLMSMALDPLVDLTSTAEERLRGALRDGDADGVNHRAGYGTGSLARAYEYDLRELERPIVLDGSDDRDRSGSAFGSGAGAGGRNAPASAQDVAASVDKSIKHSRLAGRYMREVNRYSGLVLQEMGLSRGSAGGAGGSSGDAHPDGMAADDGASGGGLRRSTVDTAAAAAAAAELAGTGTAVAAAAVGFAVGAGAGLSTLDDLPDLYLPEERAAGPSSSSSSAGAGTGAGAAQRRGGGTGLLSGVGSLTSPTGTAAAAALRMHGARGRAAASSSSSSSSGAGARAGGHAAGSSSDAGYSSSAAADTVPLRVDMRRLRAGMAAQGEGEGAEDAQVGAGVGGLGAGDEDDENGTTASRAMAEDGKGDSTAGAGKRPRSDGEAPGGSEDATAAAAAAPSASAGGDVDLDGLTALFVGRPSRTELLAGKPVSAAAKRLARDGALRATDAAAGTAAMRRARAAGGGRGTGFPRSVPSEWTDFVTARYRLIKELLLQYWAASGGLQTALAAASAAAGIAGATAAAAAAVASSRDRLGRLLRRVESEYDELQAHRERVAAAGPLAHKPGMPLQPQGSGTGAGAGAAASAAAAAAQSLSTSMRPELLVQLRAQVTAMLAMLQAPLEQAIRHYREGGARGMASPQAGK